MSRTYNGGQYTFSFEVSGAVNPENLSRDFFKKLRNPESLKPLLTDEQYIVYDTLILFKEYVEDDYVYRTLDGIERLDDFDESGFSVGFASPRFFTTEQVKDLYLNVVIPIFTSCDIASKPTGEFTEHHTYTETTAKSHKIAFC
jgi:hypothetical protein